MSSLSINSPLLSRNRPSSPTPSFQIRSSTLKEKDKQVETVIEIKNINSDIIIDIPSSSSNKNDFHEALQDFMNEFKNLEAVPIDNTDRISILEKQESESKKNIVTGIMLAIPTMAVSLGLMAGILLSKDPMIQLPLGGLEAPSISLTLYFFNDVGDNLSKNKQINKQINDLRSMPPQITLGQVKETYMEQCNDFVVTDDESDKKEFINFFDENQIVFLANTSTIIQEDSYIAFKDDILSLENKTEVTKEDFLNVIAQNVVKILQPMTLSSDENDVKRKLLETAQELLEKAKENS